MTYTAHIEAPDGIDHALNIRQDGEIVEYVGAVKAGEHGDMFAAADGLLRSNGWRPEGDPVFFWGSPEGNVFDGPWRARVERT